MSSSLCAIGRVVKVFGVRGEVIVEPMTSFPERFSGMANVLVGESEGDVKAARIESVQVGAKGIRMQFAGCPSRKEAEAFVGSFLFVPDPERVSLPDGNYFVDDLVGLQVVTENGKPVGLLTEVMKLPAQDVYVIEGENGRMMLPAVREFIRSVDIGRRVMVVRLIDGLPGE